MRVIVTHWMKPGNFCRSIGKNCRAEHKIGVLTIGVNTTTELEVVNKILRQAKPQPALKPAEAAHSAFRGVRSSPAIIDR